jgi:hypothetical protein
MDALETEFEQLDRGAAVITPDYYQKPFHAYKEGNLCW